MTLRANTVDSVDLDVALGGVLVSTDEMTLNDFDTTFTANTSKPAVDLANIVCERSWTGNFSANALNIKCNQAGAKTLIRFGGDRFALRSNSGAGTHREIVFEPVKSSAILDLQELINPLLRTNRGNVFMADSVTPTDIYLAGEVRAYLYGTSHLATLLDLTGQAYCETEKGFTDARVGGQGRLVVNGAACAVGDVEMNAGTLELRRASAFGDLVARGGVIDARQLVGDVTITGGEIGGDVTILISKAGGELDYSACDLVGGGPNVVRG